MSKLDTPSKRNAAQARKEGFARRFFLIFS
nr:MAG TPA: hypothetical protein [Caudoviricetes sp.]